MFRGICIFTIMLQVFGATTGRISALENMDYSDTSV